MSAQQPVVRSGIIAGSVTDRASRRPLAAVTIQVKESALRAVTDSEGRFTLPAVPVGTHVLQVMRLGYTPVVRTDIVVSPGRPATVEVSLEPLAAKLEAVSVPASAFVKSPDAPTSSYGLTYEEIRRSPGALGDVSRLVQSLPGVTNPDDQRNDIVARGGSPIDNLTIVDNVEVPNLNHFAAQNSTGGPISMLNTDFISEARFLAGGFPSMYGNHLSSVLDIRLRQGTRDRVRSKAEVSFAGAGAIVEGPAGKGGSFLASAREGYLRFLAKPLGLTAVPYTTNWQAKLTEDLGVHDQIWLLTIGGRDHIQHDVDEADLHATSRNSERTAGWRTTTGANWQHLFAHGYGIFGVSDALESFSSEVRDRRLNDRLTLGNHSTEGETTVKYDLSYELPLVGELKAGGSIKRFRDDYAIEQPLGVRSPYTTDSSRVDTVSVSQRLAAEIYGGYLQLTRRIGQRADLTLGARLDDFTYLSATAMSPRASIAVHLAPTVDFSVSVGRYHQQAPLVYLAAFPENRHLDPIRADHYVVGLAYEPSPGLRFSAEAYAKNYAHYPVSIEYPSLSLANTGDVYGVGGLLFPLTSRGAGRSRGVELYVQQKLTGTTYGQLSYTYSRTEDAALDGVMRRGAFDTPNAATAILGWKPSDQWEFSGRFSYATGRPHTPVLEAISVAQNRLVYDLTRVNAERSPDYNRLDLRVDRRQAVGRTWLTAYLAVQNVYARDNISRYEWNPKTHRLQALSQIGFLPVGGLTVEF